MPSGRWHVSYPSTDGQKASSWLFADSCFVQINQFSTGGGEVVLADGRRFRANSIIVSSAAVANSTSSQVAFHEWKPPLWKGTRLVAFECEKKPSCAQTLVVSAEPVDVGPIDNLSVPSAVTGYAPNGKNLIYVSVRGDWEGDDDQLTGHSSTSEVVRS